MASSRLYTVLVKYTNASNKDDAKFAVVADDPGEAVRYLMDADVVGRDMSTMNLSETNMVLVVPGYILRDQNNAVGSAIAITNTDGN